MLRAYCGLVTFDYEEWIIAVQSHVAYLGRYAPGLGINSCGVPVTRWPLSYLLAHVHMVSDMVTKENDAAKPKK